MPSTRLYDTNKIDEHSTEIHEDIAHEVSNIISGHQERFGKALQEIIPSLQEYGTEFLYNRPPPSEILSLAGHITFSHRYWHSLSPLWSE
ncbi:MAG: hypothetical protein WDN75_19425 [Bacteroidota bacterium]